MFGHPWTDVTYVVFWVKLPSGNFTKLLNIAIETVNIAIWNMVIFQSHVSLLEGIMDILLVPYLFFCILADHEQRSKLTSTGSKCDQSCFFYFMGICFQIAFFFSHQSSHQVLHPCSRFNGADSCARFCLRSLSWFTKISVDYGGYPLVMSK